MIQLKTTTVVRPNEYDIDKEINQLISVANKANDWTVNFDIGKLVGLYLAWKDATNEQR
jgi:hypothetical protein